MDKLLNPKCLFRSGVIQGIAFLVVICLYGLFFIYPSYRSVYRIQQAIVEQTTKNERLKVLYPVFVRSKILEQIPFEHRLPFPDRVRIGRGAISTLPGKIINIAEHNKLLLFESDFDINSLKNDSSIISMTIKLKGNLFDFRRFLIDMIAFEFFDSVENLSISSHEGPIKKFTLNLNIKIKKNGHE
ncbi:hypothetical protein [Desulfobacula toluolica]|uniref:Uncharacterized protein n=1 Tax=Desulfobacula toluolica (strain DSM 7467 / Tol2) TaxID=651182 RepID=K0N442_DESTT|nr:hypothetical protein [Desulfobacula toluolica]CCK78869.1 uncharacterized protein TOL2_C07000 [Desulfobacula toluolica Tol2]